MTEPSRSRDLRCARRSLRSAAELRSIRSAPRDDDSCVSPAPPSVTAEERPAVAPSKTRSPVSPTGVSADQRAGLERSSQLLRDPPSTRTAFQDHQRELPAPVIGGQAMLTALGAQILGLPCATATLPPSAADTSSACRIEDRP